MNDKYSYLISFRLEKTETYQERYRALSNFIIYRSSHYLDFIGEDETTSFIKCKFHAQYGIETIAECLLNEADLLAGDVVEIYKIKSVKTNNNNTYPVILQVGKIINKEYEHDRKTLHFLTS